MKKLVLSLAILLMAFVALNAINAYLTNMVNGVEQTGTNVLTTSEDIPFATLTIENGEIEPIILQSMSFSFWNLNPSAPSPSIDFYMCNNDGQWSPADNSIFNLNFQNINSIIQPGTDKTFILMGNIWENSNGGATICFGLSGNGNFVITGQNSQQDYLVNIIGPCQDNIFHIINQWQPMHRIAMSPFNNPIEIYPNYYQDNFNVYPGQTFWSVLGFDTTSNAIAGSMIAFNLQTIFGSTHGQVSPGNFFVADFFPDLVWAWHPEYNIFQMSHTSQNTTGVTDGSFLYETLMRTNVIENQSEYTSMNMGNYNPLFGIVSESASYERVYHPYQAIKLDVNGDNLFTEEDLDLIQQYHVGNVDLNGTNFNDNSAPNISRTSVVFFYPDNMFDLWLGNVYLNHPNEPLVQNLGIGQPYDGTWPNVIGSTYTQAENTITIETDGNCIGIFGNLPDGTPWNQTILMNENENLRWSSESHSIEPEYIQMDRNQIQFQIPAGLTHIDIQARSLAQYTPTANDDPITPTITPSLNQNFPNPFNPETSISYSLPKSGVVTIDIFNSKGQLIRSLVNEAKPAGKHTIIWNGTDNNNRPVASGIYLYRMTSNSCSVTNKMMLMK